ncbi:hypothetical protein [Paenibacillus ehimensis]|uniref:Uncharacterized protein n=1 Tax=Paenibacillus ehimensis TaxID=79264 RepID=A0ABT8V799_9BACL|nr:hypothetical protein [Paenibacillus ehimensis]MDO3676142.1 hypothetical protein [Paenibacillus ehimensis]
MKGGLYYHPDRIKKPSSPMLLDMARYNHIEYFVQLIENIVPEVLKDLETLIRKIDIAQKWFEEKKLDHNSSPSEWVLVKKSDQDKIYSGYAPLKNGLLNWASKYNLDSDNDFYIELALWALHSFYEDIQDADREERIQEAIEYAKHFGIPRERAVEWYFSGMQRNSKPFEEKVSLSGALYVSEIEFDDFHLGESSSLKMCPIIRDLFDGHFPFVFVPKSYDLTLQNIGKSEVSLNSFEEILMIKKRLIGTGWDPRTETWKEFEESMDRWFAAYKKMYRERTEKFMEQHGYVKGKEKRNQEHFKWLVHYQIQGWSLRQIAEHYEDKELSEDTIFRGVKSASEIVMLNLRQSNRTGRPRSSNAE